MGIRVDGSRLNFAGPIARAEVAADREIAAIMRPRPRMNVPDWADTYRHLSASVGAVGGPWQTHRVEVARGPLMAVTEPGVKLITAMTSTQTMKTELLLNTIGYFAHLDPAPILLLQPKDEMADAFSKERFSPMVASSPVLRDLVGDSKTRTSDDTVKYKKFPGGFLVMSSAGSPTNMAMRAIRVTLLDEIDKYETTKEGDPVELAEERTATFAHASLRLRVCSPTWSETSRIANSYEASDQRRPFVACPHCDHEQTLDFFRHVHWEKGDGDSLHRPETAAIYCESCGAAWTEAQRQRLLTTKGAIRHYQTRRFLCCDEEQDPLTTRNWAWDEENQVGYACCIHCQTRAVSNQHAGFTASKLYSPFITVVELATKWLEARHDPEKKQTFYNTQLGIPFKAEVTKAVASHFLASRREVYHPDPAVMVPEGVGVLTAGIDVQAGGQGNIGRLECEVVGWGAGEESWHIETAVFSGDPAQPHVWEELDAYLAKGFRHARGFDMRIMAACIDSGGHNSQDVYSFAKPRMGRNIWAIKGGSDRSGQWSPLWPPLEKERAGRKFRVGYRPIILGVNSGKEAIRQRLLVAEPGPGYCHFREGQPEGYFDQLTSEDLVMDTRNGVKIRKWVLRKGLANEALDCRVYAYAALHGLYHVRRLDLAAAVEAVAEYTPAPGAESVSVERHRPPEVPRRRRVGRSSFLHG